MDYGNSVNTVLHWNYRRFTEFPLERLQGEEDEITDIYLKENLISRIPSDIGKLNNLESLYLSGNDITELPREISKLTRLKCLDVSGNRLRYIPDEIGEVRNLKFLILDENEIRELPLRIAELRMLRYLSVCDNKLQWLPQRPVYNYHHCEFKFWRNPNLKAIPFSLWYHMFRGQQTRSFNIGCLTYSPLREEPYYTGRCVLQLNQDMDCKIDIVFPTKYTHIIDKNMPTAPSLFELCKRKMYEMISVAAKKLTKEPPSIYSDVSFDTLNNNNHYNNTNYNLDSDLQKENKNVYNFFSNNRGGYYVPADMIEKYFYYLPKVMKDDLCNGPVSRCENVFCKKPIFDFVYLEFCIEKIILIEDTEDIILSASFCSKSCAELWKTGKSLLNWNLFGGIHQAAINFCARPKFIKFMSVCDEKSHHEKTTGQIFIKLGVTIAGCPGQHIGYFLLRDNISFLRNLY